MSRVVWTVNSGGGRLKSVCASLLYPFPHPPPFSLFTFHLASYLKREAILIGTSLQTLNQGEPLIDGMGRRFRWFRRRRCCRRCGGVLWFLRTGLPTQRVAIMSFSFFCPSLTNYSCCASLTSNLFVAKVRNIARWGVELEGNAIMMHVWMISI